MYMFLLFRFLKLKTVSKTNLKGKKNTTVLTFLFSIYGKMQA